MQEHSARRLSARGRCRVQWELPVFDINASNSRRGVGAVHHCTPVESISKIQNYKFTELGDQTPLEDMHQVKSNVLQI